MNTKYDEIPILHVLEAMLTDAFKASAASDVVAWLDGKTLHELVGDEIADSFYARDPREFDFVESLRGGEEPSPLQSHLNYATGPDLVLVSIEGRQLPYGRLRFHKGDTSGKTWIGA